jgi:hypothetical protein
MTEPRSVVELQQQAELAAYYVAHRPPEPIGEDEDADAPATLENESARPSSFAEWFALSQTLLPALLFVPGSQPYRFPIRAAAYTLSLVAFMIWWFDRGGRKEGRHPAEKYQMWVLLVLCLSVFHPNTSIVAGVSQVALYFAIMAPLFWARAYVTTPRQLVRVLAVLIVCNGINSIVGVLQVYDPDRWMPRELSMLYTPGSAAAAAATYVGPNGRLIIRPPGLFDTPGAVCAAGSIAAMFGLIFALESMAAWKRIVAFAMAGAGLAAIYLSHIRSSLVVTVAMMSIYLIILATIRERKRVATFGTLAAAIVFSAFTLAVTLGGESVAERVSTLFQEDPATLYYKNRGMALETGFTTLLARYPLGAGLGRWGMMAYYFSGPPDPTAEFVWAEVQPSAWILDGGLFLLALYSLALVVTVFYDWRLIRSLRDPRDRLWTAAVVAANFGTLAFVFTFVPFGTQAGLQFWFLEGALHGAIAKRPRLT